MIDKTSMQGVMNVIRQAEMANSKFSESSLAISNEQPQGRFASDLLAAIRSVNDTQMRAADTKAQYEVNGDISVTDVLVDSQRASVAFEATLQVRNKILKAYQDVMSMPV
ncbi:MAG: flagellar hook-basal body complex protein FliE [Luminiphilus sp.]|jgi:flagellar hook-basal body complex protein FliE|nr:flagellar hook-basal body complex protein FliE [Luminiphilus sp.]